MVPASSAAAVGGPQLPQQPREVEVPFSDAIGEGKPRPALAREGGASLRMPIVLATQEYYPLTAGCAPEDDTTRNLQLRTTAHVSVPFGVAARRTGSHVNAVPAPSTTLRLIMVMLEA